MKNLEENDTFLAKWLAGEVSEEEKKEFENSEEGKDMQAIIKATELLKVPPYDTEGELKKLKSRLTTTPKEKTSAR